MNINRTLSALINKISLDESIYIYKYLSKISLNSKNLDKYLGKAFKFLVSKRKFDLQLSKSKFNIYVFNENKINQGKTEKLFIRLHQEIKESLISYEINKDKKEIEKEIIWLEILLQKQIKDRFEINLKKLQKKVNSMSESFEKYKYTYHLNNIIHEFNTLHNIQKDDVNIYNTIKSLDNYLILYRTELLNTLFLQSGAAKISTPQDQIDQNNNHFLFKMIESINELYVSTEKNPLKILELYEKIKIDEQKYSFDTLIIIHNHLRNLLTLYHNSGVPNILKTIFRIQKEQLERGLLHDNGQLTINTYINIFQSALRFKEYDWAISFLEKYKDQIRGETENRVYYKFNMARYYFEIKDFESSLDITPDLIPEPVYSVALKRLEIRNYYELNSNLLNYKMDSFKMYLSRNSKNILSDSIYIHQLNFINILFQITASIPGDKKRAVAIIRRILQKRTVADKEWLLEKARELGRLSEAEYEAALQI